MELKLKVKKGRETCVRVGIDTEFFHFLRRINKKPIANFPQSQFFFFQEGALPAETRDFYNTPSSQKIWVLEVISNSECRRHMLGFVIKDVEGIVPTQKFCAWEKNEFFLDKVRENYTFVTRN